MAEMGLPRSMEWSAARNTRDQALPIPVPDSLTATSSPLAAVGNVITSIATEFVSEASPSSTMSEMRLVPTGRDVTTTTFRAQDHG